MDRYENYEDKLALLEKLEKQGVPKDMQGMFCSQKGHCLVMTNHVREGVSYLQKAALSGEGISLFEQRCACSSYLMALHYLDGISDEELRDANFLYGQLFPKTVPFSHARRDRRKIRIGYLGNNLAGCVEGKFIVPLLSMYDRNRYEVYVYDIYRGKRTWVADLFLDRFSGSIAAWRELSGVTIEDAARRIYEDEIDILFDLEGHTMSGITLQIAAFKPAPVQLCGIGYFDTTGLPAMDYFLGDTYCDTQENDALFSEQVLRLPHSHLCYHEILSPTGNPGAYRVHSPIVFSSFNNFQKITDSMLELWHDVIDRVSGSRLLLKNVGTDPKIIDAMRCRAMRAGFRDGQVEVRPATTDGDYMAEYMDVDIALDTYPYPGGGTTCDALYMGVPVISLYGSRHGSRFGYSILSNVGVGELAARSPEEYVEKAVSLASDLELLTLLHHNLRDMMRRSPVMDGKLYNRDIEDIYEKVWEKWKASAH